MLSSFSSFGYGAEPTPKPMNVVMIAVDDLNHWVRHLGRNNQVLTPNIDKLAARGVSFYNANCASAVCNPSRTALLTGMRPSTTGVYANEVDWRTIIPDGYALPGQLRRNGYYTFGAGKIFHNSQVIRPSDWDEYAQNPKDESIVQAENSRLPAGGGRGPGGKTLRYTAGELTIAELAGGDEETGDYQTASAAIAALGRSYDKPFFIACGIFRPHLPWHVPQKYFELYKEEDIQLPPLLPDDLADIPGAKPSPEHLAIVKEHMWKKAIRAYMACITYADAQVGRVLDALEKSSYKDNTIIVLWGDHGWHLGEKERWRKATLWEEANRMPYVWYVPGLTPKGIQSKRTVDLMSVYPTLFELLNLPRPAHVEGSSIVPLLKDPAAPWEIPALSTWHQGNHTVRTEKWRYLEWEDGRAELYNHEDDPYEWYNLLHASNAARAKAHDIPAVVASLKASFPKINRSAEEGKAFFESKSGAPSTAPKDDKVKEERKKKRKAQKNAGKEE